MYFLFYTLHVSAVSTDIMPTVQTSEEPIGRGRFTKERRPYKSKVVRRQISCTHIQLRVRGYFYIYIFIFPQLGLPKGFSLLMQRIRRLCDVLCPNRGSLGARSVCL